MNTAAHLAQTSSHERPVAVAFPFFAGLAGIVALLYFFREGTEGSLFYPLVAALGAGFLILSFFSIQTGLILMTFAMLFSPEIQVSTIGPRALVIRAEDVLIPILAMAWLARLAIHREFRPLVSSPLNKPIGLFLALSIGSTMWGISQGAAPVLPAIFYLLKTIEFLLIFFLVLNYVRTARQVNIFLFFTLLTVTLIGIYTLFQVPETEVFSEKRISAPFEGVPQPASVGGYMAFLLLIVLSLFLCDSQPFRKVLYAIMGVIIFIPFLFTFNRTSYAALIVGAILVTLLVKKVWVMAVLSCFLLTAPLWAPQTVRARIAYTWEDAINPGREMGVDVSFQERIHQYKKMWNSVRGSPFIGLGVASYDYLDSQYARTFHEVGIIGLGLWLWVILRLFRVSYWLFKTLPRGPLKGMSLGYAAGLAGLLVHSFGVITFYVVRIMEPFWFMSGLVVSLYLVKVSEKQQEEERQEEEFVA